MKKSENNAFAGLPVALVEEILENGGKIANKIYGPYREIKDNRDKLREQLQEQNGIKNDSTTDGQKILSSCGIDGYYTVEGFLTSDLTCSAAFAVEGLVPPSGQIHWDNPSHRSLFQTEQQTAETAGILCGIMMEMEIELAAGSPHEVILLNGSFITPFLTFMEALKLASGSKESSVSQEFINRIKSAIMSFNTIFNSQNKQKIWVGIPQNTSKKELVNKLNWPQNYKDKILFTILLSPGEFTTPLPVEQSELEQVKNLAIKDESFSTLRDRVVSAIGELQVLYYRPYGWTPVLRIEIDSSIASDSSRLSQLLNSIKYQCSSAGIAEPYPIHYAKKMVKSLDKAIPSLRKSAISQITNLYKDDLGDVFPLLMFTV